MKNKQIILLVIAIILVSACATKHYGRMQPLTGYESQEYTCKDIKVELSKIDAFELQVEKESEFSALSVASFLGDFGIGNIIEKDSAIKTAKERRVQLNDLFIKKNCQ